MNKQPQDSKHTKDMQVKPLLTFSPSISSVTNMIRTAKYTRCLIVATDLSQLWAHWSFGEAQIHTCSSEVRRQKTKKQNVRPGLSVLIYVWRKTVNHCGVLFAPTELKSLQQVHNLSCIIYNAGRPDWQCRYECFYTATGSLFEKLDVHWRTSCVITNPEAVAAGHLLENITHCT